MKKQQPDSQLVTKKKELNEVAEDKNWRSYVANEIKGADNWTNDWGFLVSEGILLVILLIMMLIDGAMEMSKEEKIRMLEEKLEGMNSQRVSKTTGASYG
jgi:hypothetical protein